MHKHYWTVITVLALSGMVSCSSGDQKVNNEPQCVDDDKRCNQETPQKCIGGTWVDQETCDENNKCNKGDCIENHPSATTTNTCEGNGLRCSYSGVPQKCVDDQWVDQDSCTSDEKCVNRETGENTLDFCARLFYDVACARGAAAESVRDYRPSLPDPDNAGAGKPDRICPGICDVVSSLQGGLFFCPGTEQEEQKEERSRWKPALRFRACRESWTMRNCAELWMR